MYRLSITNKETGEHFFPETKEQPLGWIEKQPYTYGQSERRIPIADLLARLHTDENPAIYVAETNQLIVGDIEVPLADVLPNWDWKEADGTPHPIRVEGVDFVSDCQYEYTAEDITDEERRNNVRREIEEQVPISDQLEAIFDALASFQMTGDPAKLLTEEVLSINGKRNAARRKYPKREPRRDASE